jgi:arylsulfatase A-like enzyme
MHGRDLYPLMEGNAAGWRTEWFYEHLFEHAWIPRSEAIRTERWKYSRYVGCEPVFEELFDLRSDPLEERNLARDPAHRATLDQLRARWQRWRDRLDNWRPGAAWEEPS